MRCDGVKGNLPRFIGRHFGKHVNRKACAQAVCSALARFFANQVPIFFEELFDKGQRMVKNRVRNRCIRTLIICQKFRPPLKLVCRIETRHIAVRVRGETHVGRHRATHRGVTAAKGMLKPKATTQRIAGRIFFEVAAVCELPYIRRHSRVAFEHLIENATLERFTHNEHDVVGLFRLVFVRRSAPVHRKFQSIATPRSKILRQEGIQITHQFFGDFGVIMNEFKSLDCRNVQNRSGKRMLAERKAHVDFRVRHGDFNPAASARKEQHERHKRESHANGEHRAGNFTGGALPGAALIAKHERTALFTEPKRVDGYKCNCARKAEDYHRYPKHRPEHVATESRNRRGIGDV